MTDDTKEAARIAGMKMAITADVEAIKGSIDRFNYAAAALYAHDAICAGGRECPGRKKLAAEYAETMQHVADRMRDAATTFEDFKCSFVSSEA
jgi:hypothetical protein